MTGTYTSISNFPKICLCISICDSNKKRSDYARNNIETLAN